MTQASQGLIGQILRFGLVGSIGFVVDGGVLWGLVQAGVDPYLARALSFPVAVVVTWVLNRVWTFARADRTGPAKQLKRYLTIQTAGALCNYAVFSAYLFVVALTPTNIMIGFALGSVVGMGLNFFGARAVVFRR